MLGVELPWCLNPWSGLSGGLPGVFTMGEQVGEEEASSTR